MFDFTIKGGANIEVVQQVHNFQLIHITWKLHEGKSPFIQQ